MRDTDMTKIDEKHGTETIDRYINFFKEHLQETCNHKLSPAIVKQVRDCHT